MSARYKHVSVVLLLLVLAALACDLLIHSHSVYAQNSLTVYVTKAPSPRQIGSDGKGLTVKGAEVVGFSCGEARGFVLSK